MVGLGGMEMILLFGLLGGMGNLDIVSALPTREYLQMREIDVSADRLMEVAGQTPDSARKQIHQLVALRHLAGDIDLLKKSAKAAEHRRLLTEISEGKKASDPAGFAADYARKVLAAWDGTPLPRPADRAWRENLKGLPDKATLVAVVDLQGTKTGEAKLPDLAPLMALMPKEAKEQMFAAIEGIGNIAVTRVAVAFVEADAGFHEIYVRVTGRGNPEWIEKLFQEYKLKEARTGPAGEAIRVMTSERPGPAIAVVGKTDIFFAGALPAGKEKEVPAKHLEVLDRFLTMRDQAQPGPAQGTLKDDLASVPASAGSVLVGRLPKAMREGPMQMPQKILAHTQRTAGGLDLQITGTMANAEAAKGLVQMIDQGREAALKEMAKLQGQPLPVPGINIASMVSLLESIQLQTKGDNIEVRMLVQDSAMLAYPLLGLFAFRAVPPPGN